MSENLDYKVTREYCYNLLKHKLGIKILLCHNCGHFFTELYSLKPVVNLKWNDEVLLCKGCLKDSGFEFKNG